MTRTIIAAAKDANDLVLAICDVADEADAAGPGPHGDGMERARGVQRAIAKAEEMHHAIVRVETGPG